VPKPIEAGTTAHQATWSESEKRRSGARHGPTKLVVASPATAPSPQATPMAAVDAKLVNFSAAAPMLEAKLVEGQSKMAESTVSRGVDQGTQASDVIVEAQVAPQPKAVQSSGSSSSTATQVFQ
jgi:hypothetical protein